MKKAPINKKSNAKKLPDRYSIKKSHDGLYITCLESPHISVRLERGRVFSESNGKKSPERTIFLDGVCDSPPFLDTKKQIYNLDHHTGIIRSFTLSTCEQAAILVLKGLDLNEKNWTIWANDPDLDTVLAIWILLNHMYLIGREESYSSRILPIIRLEGLIDGLGLELTKFTALPPDVLDEAQTKIESLRKKELSIKKSGKWEETDLLDYTIQVLKKIDEIVFSPEDFKDFKGLDELARLELDDKLSAVVYSTNMGIYEIEKHLNRVYGRNPGLIILQKSENHYTIRKSDLFTPLDMNLIYEKLNIYDRYVNGKKPGNRWGGAGDIGGSPRDTGTALSPREIVSITQEGYRKPNLLERTIQFSWVSLIALCLPFISWLLVSLVVISDSREFWILESWGLPLELFSLVLVFYALVLFFGYVYKKHWVYGFKFPYGREWLYFFPGIFLGTCLGGAWIPSGGEKDADWIFSLGFVLIYPLFIEMVFRGIIHGRLMQMFRIQVSGGEWFISKPVLLSTLLYSSVFALVPVHSFSLVDRFFSVSSVYSPYLYTICGSFLLGMSLGLCRERGESIIPGIVFQSLSLVIVILISLFLPRLLLF